MKINYSIIIPTLNEEKNLPLLLNQLEFYRKTCDESIEIIVVDGFSDDKTIEICNKNKVKYVLSKRGRGNQLNEGADFSSNDLLIFIHADTILPINIFRVIKNEFLISDKIATFKLKFDKTNFLYSLYSFFTKYDSILTTFGDQIIVIRKDYFYKIGKFPNWKFMEDVDLLKRARKGTKIKKLSSHIITSSRRFNKIGIIKTQIKNFVFIIRYLLGTSPDILYELYYETEKENKRNNHIYKISSTRKGENQISFNNK